MIVCKKCGGKYEDDMPQCLWCDAPNPELSLNRGKEPAATVTTEVRDTDAKSCETSPEPSEPVAIITPAQEQDDDIERLFRQKGILWSVVLAGPFVSWLCHYKYLKSVDKFSVKFFLPLFGIQCVSRYLFHMLSKVYSSEMGTLGHFLLAVVIIAVCLFYWFIIGKFGMVLLKKAIPDYDPNAFKKREHVGIAIGIPFFILDIVAGYLHYSSTARMLGVWLGTALQ